MVSILAVPEGAEVLVIGTIYKDMKLKPSILDEYVKVDLDSDSRRPFRELKRARLAGMWTRVCENIRHRFGHSCAPVRVAANTGLSLILPSV